jgi:hypothetical protein
MGTYQEPRQTSPPHCTKLLRVVLRIVAGVVLVAFGALLAVSGGGTLWSMLEQAVAPAGTAAHYYWVQIGKVTLHGWQIYACAALFLLVGAACIGLGLSLLTKRKQN